MEKHAGPEALDFLIENPRFAELLADAVKRSNGRQTLQTLVGELVAERAALWTRKNSAIVTQLLTYPTGARWVSVRLGTGHMGTLKAMMPGIEDYAKSLGCAGVESVARAGWARVGKRLGYAETHRFIEKAIDNE